MSLCLHSGANIVELECLRETTTPEATATWTPVPHFTLLNRVKNALQASGQVVKSEEHALYKGGDRYFGLLHLDSTNGSNTVVGVRNSHDRTFPAGLSMGNRVFVCDNLSFSGDVVLKRRHTKYIERDLDNLIYRAVGRLGELKVAQEQRLLAYKNTQLTDPEAHSMMIRALRARVVSGDQVARVAKAWEEPAYEPFKERTAWSLFNGFTEVLKGTAPTMLVKRTMALQGLFNSFCIGV